MNEIEKKTFEVLSEEEKAKIAGGKNPLARSQAEHYDALADKAIKDGDDLAAMSYRSQASLWRSLADEHHNPLARSQAEHYDALADKAIKDGDDLAAMSYRSQASLWRSLDEDYK